MDNIFIERLWHSLKYEAIYLHELTDFFWLHSSFDGKTPAEAYGAVAGPMDMMG